MVAGYYGTDQGNLVLPVISVGLQFEGATMGAECSQEQLADIFDRGPPGFFGQGKEQDIAVCLGVEENLVGETITAACKEFVEGGHETVSSPWMSWCPMG